MVETAPQITGTIVRVGQPYPDSKRAVKRSSSLEYVYVVLAEVTLDDGEIVRHSWHMRVKGDLAAANLHRQQLIAAHAHMIGHYADGRKPDVPAPVSAD